VSRARIRRPLIALVALVLALVIGYTVRALNSHDGGGHPSPQPSPQSSQSSTR
jgi:hypothetical protein